MNEKKPAFLFFSQDKEFFLQVYYNLFTEPGALANLKLICNEQLFDRVVIPLKDNPVLKQKGSVLITATSFLSPKARIRSALTAIKADLDQEKKPEDYYKLTSKDISVQFTADMVEMSAAFINPEIIAEVNIEDIENYLLSLGIKVPLIRVNIRKMIDPENLFTMFLVAKGIKPYPKTAQKILYFAANSMCPVPNIPLSSIEKQLIVSGIGRVRAIMIGSTPALPIGKDVYNREVPLKEENISADVKRGELNFEDIKKVELHDSVVELFRKHSKDVYFEHNHNSNYMSLIIKNKLQKNLNFNGNIILINGLERNLSIYAQGSIQINRDVERVNIKTENESIFISGGYFGSVNHTIISGADITADFITNASLVFAKNSITVKNGIFAASVIAGQDIAITSDTEEMGIVGGVIQFGARLITPVLGNTEEECTTILFKDFIKVDNEVVSKAVEEEKSKIKLSLLEIADQLDQESLSEVEIKDLVQKYYKKNKEYVTMFSQPEGESVINKQETARFINIKQYLYPGVIIKDRVKEIRISKKYHAVSIFKDEEAFKLKKNVSS